MTRNSKIHPVSRRLKLRQVVSIVISVHLKLNFTALVSKSVPYLLAFSTVCLPCSWPQSQSH